MNYINIYKVSEIYDYDDNRLRVKMLTNHKKFGGKRGEWSITSEIKFIDKAKGVL